MKKHFADTNFYLRYILQDNEQQADKAEQDLKKAKDGKKRIVFISSVILEMAFVLKQNYAFLPSEIAYQLLLLVKTPYLEIENRQVWIMVFPIYVKSAIDLLDIFLFVKAREEKGEVLSFDRDFVKLAKIASERKR